MAVTGRELGGTQKGQTTKLCYGDGSSGVIEAPHFSLNPWDSGPSKWPHGWESGATFALFRRRGPSGSGRGTAPTCLLTDSVSALPTGIFLPLSFGETLLNVPSCTTVKWTETGDNGDNLPKQDGDWPLLVKLGSSGQTPASLPTETPEENELQPLGGAGCWCGARNGRE